MVSINTNTNSLPILHFPSFYFCIECTSLWYTYYSFDCYSLRRWYVDSYKYGVAYAQNEFNNSFYLLHIHWTLQSFRNESIWMRCSRKIFFSIFFFQFSFPAVSLRIYNLKWLGTSISQIIWSEIHIWISIFNSLALNSWTSNTSNQLTQSR